MEAVVAANGGVRPTEWPKHWGNAGNLFARGVPLETAIACYQAEVQRPRWDSGYCPVSEILAKYAAFQKSPDNFRESVKRQRAAASGAYDRNASSSSSRPQPRPQVSARPTDPFAD